ATVQLKDNPDRPEILADLEQAIGDKCQRFLGPHKSVVGATEIGQVLTEMGPVEGPEIAEGAGMGGHTASRGGSASKGHPRVEHAPRRLYRIMDGAMVGGVCNGLAAYFNVDPTLVRIGFVLV